MNRMYIITAILVLVYIIIIAIPISKAIAELLCRAIDYIVCLGDKKERDKLKGKFF